jgi:hypothetical protein
VPLVNHVKIDGPDIAKVLEPGEQLRALGSYRRPLNGDSSALELADDELTGVEKRFLTETGERVPPTDKLFLGVDWTGVHLNSDRINRFLFGRDGSGAVESIAGRMWRAGRAPTGKMRHWAVTDRRLLLLLQTIGTVPSVWEVEFAVPLASVRSARRRGKLLFEWGLVEITFVDGSTLGVLAGIVDVALAGQLVRALTNKK